jgi:hypothetical protein
MDYGRNKLTNTEYIAMPSSGAENIKLIEIQRIFLY